jgi:hypothetical protein
MLADCTPNTISLSGHFIQASKRLDVQPFRCLDVGMFAHPAAVVSLSV